MEYLSSIVYHTVILKCLQKGENLRNVASFLYNGKKKEYLSSIVLHTIIMKMLSKREKSRYVDSFLYKRQN